MRLWLSGMEEKHKKGDGVNGKTPRGAWACVIDVSLCGEDPSTRSQMRQSSQNHKLSELIISSPTTKSQLLRMGGGHKEKVMVMMATRPQSAWACVVDVSLCGDDPSTRSQTRQSSQKHKLYEHDKLFQRLAVVGLCKCNTHCSIWPPARAAHHSFSIAVIIIWSLRNKFSMGVESAISTWGLSI